MKWLILLCFSVVSVAQDGPQNGRDVMQLANNQLYYSGKDRIVEGHISVKEKSGSIRIRDFKMLRLDDEPDGGVQHYYVYFTRPSDLAGTTFLVTKNPGGDDERRLFLPKLDLVRRIAAGDKRTHFVGTDFFYEDVSGRHLDDDTHELIEQSDKYWIVESKPVKAGSVEFARYKAWVHKKTHLVIKLQFFDSSDKLYRQFQVKKVRNIQGNPSVFKTVLDDFNRESQTTIDILFMEYDTGMPQSLFAESYLRNPPLKWLNRGAEAQ